MEEPAGGGAAALSVFVKRRKTKEFTQRTQRIHRGHRDEGIGGGDEVDGGGFGEGD
jgi:hypothetical protein